VAPTSVEIEDGELLRMIAGLGTISQGEKKSGFVIPKDYWVLS